MAERVTYIRLAWAGGTHRFHLQPPKPVLVNPHIGDLAQQMREMATTQDRGPEPELHDRERAILGRLTGAAWGSLDVSIPILVGLVKGGDFRPLKPTKDGGAWREPQELVVTHVLKRPLAESVTLAQAILAAVIYGVPQAVAEAEHTSDAIVGALAGMEV